MKLTDFFPGPGRGAGFKLGQDGAQVAQGVLQHLAWPGQQPLVSCLMVTRGRLFPARFAVDCFRAQGWASRELVLVCDAPGTAIEAYCRQLGDERIRLALRRRDDEERPIGGCDRREQRRAHALGDGERAPDGDAAAGVGERRLLEDGEQRREAHCV